MTTTTRTTELEAINTMLSCIDESPINSLDVTGLLDVDEAKSVLNEISRAVQEKGWQFNKDDDYTMIRDASSNIAYPPNALKLQSTDDFFIDYPVVQRGSKLYNRKTKSFVFDKDIHVNIVWLLTFEDMPEAARRYIMIRAARVFQGRRQGAETQYKFSSQDEQDAFVGFQDLEGDSGEYNMVYGNAATAEILRRY